MRLAGSVLIAVLLAACGGRATTSLAWPKQSEKEVDGGESLEPRAIAAMPEKEADDEEEVVEETPEDKPAEVSPPVEDTPTAVPPPPPPPDEPITTEEIVIEIEED